MSVSLFSRPYSSISAPRCALGLSLCRPSETMYCLFEPFKYNHVAFAYFSFLSNPLLHRSCRPPVESILPHASLEHSAEYHSHVPTLVLFNRSPDPEMKSRGNEWGHVIPKADSKF